MEFIEGSRGIYRPIEEFFDTPIYKKALQICWHLGSYEAQIKLMAELLRLQQQTQLPSQVTADDLIQLLAEESKNSQRGRRWEFELDCFDDAETRLLLKLVWAVNTSMWMRDVEFGARRLLNSPEAIPPQFQKPKIINQAQEYAKRLTEQQQEDLLRAHEVGWEVVPKVLQSFWLYPRKSSSNMPSQQLSKMAVGVTKAVEDRVAATLPTMLHLVRFSRTVRDAMVLSISQKVRQAYTQDVLFKNIKSFSPDLLDTIADAAAKEICRLFTPKPAVVEEAETTSVGEFFEGRIYTPIKVLFDTPIYERALQICWHISSYKIQTAVMTEFLRLQQQNQLPCEVTAEDMIQLLVEESKSSLREQLWEFELEDFDEIDAKPLLQLVWSVNNSMKMRDVEFEAKRLLNSPETIPPQFQHPRIITQAKNYAKILMEQQQQQAPKLLCPRDIVLEVVPKVLQSFWLYPRKSSSNMPSQQLSKMAVGATKAVEDRVAAALPSMHLQFPLSRSIRDTVVQLIKKKVSLGYTQEGLKEVIKSFAPELLNTITDVAAKEICVLFEPWIPATRDVIRQEGVAQKAGNHSASPEPDPAAAQTPQPPLTPPAEPPAISPDETPLSEPAVSPSPLPPLMPEVLKLFLDAGSNGDPTIKACSEVISEHSVEHQELPVTQVKVFSFKWGRKIFHLTLLSEDTD